MKKAFVSKFKNYKNSHPETTISLFDWLNDDSYKSDVDHIRSLDSKDERNRLKSNLPSITPSGTFTRRKADCLIEHSGFICIDIDSGDNPDITNFENLRDQLKNVLNIAYSGLSVSGKGVFCLIPIMYPDKHKEHFEALKICFEKLGIIVDKACSDVSRLRGYSYDADAYFNNEAKVFYQILDYKKIIEKTLPKSPYKKLSSNTANPNSTTSSTKKRVIKIVDKINNLKIDITHEYEQWFQIGCAIASEFGEEGREMFHDICRHSDKYYFERNDRDYNSFIANSYSFKIGTFFHYAEKYDLK